jgi:hypothetical protein
MWRVEKVLRLEVRKKIYSLPSVNKNTRQIMIFAECQK